MWPFRKRKPVVPSGPFVEKRRVTMLSTNGHRAIDFVPLEKLDAYVADARTRWAQVLVGEVHDSGPGGDYGPTASLDHLESNHAD